MKKEECVKPKRNQHCGGAGTKVVSVTLAPTKEQRGEVDDIKGKWGRRIRYQYSEKGGVNRSFDKIEDNLDCKPPRGCGKSRENRRGATFKRLAVEFLRGAGLVLREKCRGGREASEI